MAQTRAEIRRAVAAEVGDYRPLIATADGGASTFTDDRRLTDETNYYAGADIIITGGPPSNPQANMNEIRTVISSDPTTRTLTVAPDWNEPPPAGSTAELYNLAGMGARVDEWNSFINNSVREAQEFAKVRGEVLIGTFSQQSYFDPYYGYSDYQQSIAIPDGLDYISAVRYVKDGLVFYPQRGDSVRGEGYWIDDVGHRVVIEGDAACDFDGATLYAIGYGPPDEMGTDQDTTSLPGSWLYAKVKAKYYTRVQEKGLFDYRSEQTKWEGIANGEQRLISKISFPPNTVRLL